MSLPSLQRFASRHARYLSQRWRRPLSSPGELNPTPLRASYHEKVLDHFQNPRNVGSLDRKSPNVGTGVVGSPACGDVMKLQIQVDENGRIVDARFKTFGCGSAIASSSLATEWMKGKTLDESLRIRNRDIAQELRLPPVKLHCSMLAEEAIEAAVRDYKEKQQQQEEDKKED